MAKKKSKFNSLSTPGTRQDLSNYLVELIFLRKNKGIRLQPKFWQQTKYKFLYRREIQACRKFIKKYGEAFVFRVATDNYITTWTDFAKIEFLLQQWAERKENKKLPKDTSSVDVDFVLPKEDLRESKTFKRKKSMFERLKEIE